MEVYKGKIIMLRGSWMSGIANLIIEDEKRGMVSIPCENAQTVRCMEGAFGNVIGEGHTIDNRNGGHLGKEVYYSVGDFGVLEAFTPVEEAPPELVRIYEEAIP
jgi:hypothetical protein